MPKKRTIPIDAEVGDQLTGTALDAAYADMAADQARETEAAEWCAGLIGDVADYDAPLRSVSSVNREQRPN